MEAKLHHLKQNLPPAFNSLLGTDAERDSAIKLAQERAEIVAKYDRGREGMQIEPWEDADYLLYKVTDRFGFLQCEESAVCSKAHLLGEDCMGIVAR
ncbi:UNVERIFIED_CONTAM: hypothetical protein K2H54_075541 [Gekko kuhli]